MLKDKCETGKNMDILFRKLVQPFFKNIFAFTEDAAVYLVIA